MMKKLLLIDMLEILLNEPTSLRLNNYGVKMSELITALKNEADRIQEDAETSAKGHYNASEKWRMRNLQMGIPAAILTVIVSIVSYTDFPFIAGMLAMLSTTLIAVMTFLNSSEIAQKHKASAGYYHALRNRARIFKEIELINNTDETQLRKKLLELAAERDHLNHLSLIIPRKEYEKAQKDVNESRTIYRIDKENC